MFDWTCDRAKAPGEQRFTADGKVFTNFINGEKLASYTWTEKDGVVYYVDNNGLFKPHVMHRDEQQAYREARTAYEAELNKFIVG